jgi:nickel/cobalt transporter (NicO) family protein
MQLICRVLMLMMVLIGFGLPLAQAQETVSEPQKKSVIIDKRKLLVQPRNADGTIQESPFMADPVLWMRTKQQNFYGRMGNAIRQLKTKSATAAAWTLLSISFFYGVFHAAGPGHGKAVVTGWVLATENELRRGILIAFMSAIIQALTAIAVVSVLVVFVGGASAMARDIAGFLESASYAMIGLMGLYLIWNGWNSFRPKAVAVKVAGPFEMVSRPQGSVLMADHVHDDTCGCGHAHAPAAAEVKGDWSWTRAFAMAFAVGIRPCSGALLVLVASYALGLYWAGILSTLAMGVGVFLTIATIAALAVYAKSWAFRLTGADNLWMRFAVRWGKVCVGVLIAGFGALLFAGSIGSNNLVM